MAWGALAIASAILLLVNGANRFYASPPPKVAYVPGMQAFTAPAASATTPAGWYPVDGGQLRWWDGNAWTDHFHTEG
jgi:hypothetical protein